MEYHVIKRNGKPPVKFFGLKVFSEYTFKVVDRFEFYQLQDETFVVDYSFNNNSNVVHFQTAKEAIDFVFNLDLNIEQRNSLIEKFQLEECW